MVDSQCIYIKRLQKTQLETSRADKEKAGEPDSRYRNHRFLDRKHAPNLLEMSESKEIIFMDKVAMGMSSIHAYLMGTLIDRLIPARNLSLASR